MLERTSTLILRIIDSPLPWAIGGLAVGFALGVTTISVWLLVAGLIGYLVYLALHGPAYEGEESNLVAAGPVLMVAWMFGFILKDLV